MAWESPLYKLPAAIAAADYRTTSKQYYCVTKNATNNQVALATTDGEIFIGVLQNEPLSGAAAEVTCIGVTKVVAGETLTAGDYWGTDSSGKAKIVEHTNTGADIGDYIAGVVLEGAAADELATVTIGFPITGRVEAA